ncbi:biotin--[acetyl-CoA-carboxylase] ligase [Candidatus Bipolaricaulota bacterium]
MESIIHHIERTASTQLEARKLIAEGGAKTGDIVLSNEQTAGRGRFGRTWISPNGGLYATVILPVTPLLSLKAGLAVVRVLRSASLDAGLKWPNDVLVEDRKIAGVLVETDGERSLVGIGLNLTSAPLDTATCVARYVDVHDRDEWARAIAGVLFEMASGKFVLDEYRSACLTLGSPVRIDGFGENPPGEGIAVDVDDNGRLVVQTGKGKRTVSSGECLHLRAPNLGG